MTSHLGLRVGWLVVALACAWGAGRGRAPHPVPLARPLAGLPLTLEDWRGGDAAAIDATVRSVLGADDYLNRVYTDERGTPMGLYMAYYASQGEGDSIHSPLHCLPGNGWQPERQTRSVVQLAGRALPLNHYVVRRRDERQLVLYWFQGRGRIVASEYANKALLLVDAFRAGRTDGALVRVMTPIGESEHAADEAAVRFIAALQTALGQWL
jgi:EpsI family protein